MFFIHQIVVIPAACPGSARTIYAGTDGAGVLKGVQSCTTGNWTWTTVNGGLTGQDLYVTSLVRGSGAILAGTKAGGIFLLSGSTWGLLPGSPEDQGHAYNVPNILLVGFPNNVFAATEGGGVYRWDDDRATFHAINNGTGLSDLTDLQVHALAYNPANQVLYAGTTDHVSGTAGNVWHIQLTPPVLTFASPFTYEVGDSVNDVVGVTSANQAPANWFAMITAGALPPGLAEGVNNTPYPPVVNVSGSPTEDGCYTATLTVWDDLFNRVDLAADYFINPGVAIDAIPNPAPFGTVMNFSSVVTGAMGSVTYEWDFDSTGVQVAPGTWISADPNPTFIYPVADSYVAQLTVTDDLGGGCVRVTVKTIPIDVFGALTASPTATQTGSGAQFQFKANATGGNPICATVDGYSYAWEFKDANTGTVLFTSNVANPIITFANTGDFIGEVTVTDCDGHSYTASVSVNWNGSMAATLSSSNNPAPSNYPIEFTATGLAGALYSFYDFTFDMGDGTVIGPIPWAGPPGTVPTVPVVYAYTGVCPTADFTVTATIVANSVLPTPPLTTVVTFTQHVYAAFLGVTGSVVPDPLTCQLTSDQAITLTLQPNGLPDCAQGGLKPFRYSIDWGDGATTTMDFNDYAAHSFPHMYAAGGPYTITAYVTDTGNPQVTQTYVHGPFTVIAPLSATTPYVDGLRCNQGDAFGVQLSTLTGSRLVSFSTVNSGGVGPYTYVWNFGDGTATSTAAAPTHTYTIPAGYNHYTWTATVTVTDTGDCSSPHHVVTNTIKFTLFYPLSIVGTPDWQQQCGSRTVDFDATSNVQGGIEPYSYVWNFDDGTSQTTTTPARIPIAPQPFSAFPPRTESR